MPPTRWPPPRGGGPMIGSARPPTCSPRKPAELRYFSICSPICSSRSLNQCHQQRIGSKAVSMRHYAACYRCTQRCAYHGENERCNGGYSNTPKSQLQYIRLSSPSTTPQQHGSNLSSKSPSGQLCMIGRSQMKKASASNEAGKASNHTKHAQPRHTFLPITPIEMTGTD